MTVTIAQHLPDYKTPPIDEVVCGVLFEPLVNFLLPHFGLLWEKFKQEYPRCQEVTPLLPITEDPEQTSLRELAVSELPLPRVWFMHNDGRIIQIQRDRFLHNWRKLQPDTEYPRYRVVFQMFQAHFSAFQNFLSENNLGVLVPRQYEMTYVNVIYEDEGWKTIEEVSEIFPDFSWRTKEDRFLPNPVGVNWKTVFPLPDHAGRLHLDIQTGRRQDDNRRLFRFEITARGIGVDLSPHGMQTWFNLAHEWIVRSFADYTGDRIQKEVWGLKT